MKRKSPIIVLCGCGQRFAAQSYRAKRLCPKCRLREIRKGNRV